MSRDVAFGTQVARSEDRQPQRVVMVGPDGRAVQVMAEDVAGFAERGFVLRELTQPTTEPPARPQRTKAAPAATEEES